MPSNIEAGLGQILENILLAKLLACGNVLFAKKKFNRCLNFQTLAACFYNQIKEINYFDH